MPTIKKMRLKPQEFHKGDKVNHRGADWTVERSISVRRKYATVAVEESAEPFDLSMEREYTVWRSVPTKQEEFERARDFLEDELRDDLLKALSKRQEALKLFRENDNPSFWEFEAWAKSNAQYYLKNYLMRCLMTVVGVPLQTARMSDLGGIAGVLDRCDPGDLLQALNLMLPEIQREVWRKDSVSSNLWSNAQDETQKDVKRDWFDYWNTRVAALETMEMLAAKEEL